MRALLGYSTLPTTAPYITDDGPRRALRSTRNRLRAAMHLGAALPGGGGACRGCSPRCQAVAQGGRDTGPRAGRPPGHQVPKVLPHSWAEDRSDGEEGGGERGRRSEEHT